MRTNPHQRRLERLPFVHRAKISQPVVARAQHIRDEVFSDGQIVVQMREQRGHVVSDGDRIRIRVVHVCEQGARGFPVERAGVVDAFRLRTEARQQRHLPGDRRVQRIDRLHAQARRMSQNIPVTLGVPLECGTGETAGVLVTVVVGVRRIGKRIENAFAHFGSGLAGEGDGNDFFRFLDPRQQCEIALDKQSRLARTGRCAHDERLRNIECALALGVIFDGA